MATKARAIASWALSAYKARDKTTMLTLHKSLVRSRLEYCYPLWNCHNDEVTDIQVLEGVQKHLLPGYGDCNIWIIGSVSKNLNYVSAAPKGALHVNSYVENS